MFRSRCCFGLVFIIVVIVGVIGVVVVDILLFVVVVVFVLVVVVVFVVVLTHVPMYVRTKICTLLVHGTVRLVPYDIVPSTQYHNPKHTNEKIYSYFWIWYCMLGTIW